MSACFDSSRPALTRRAWLQATAALAAGGWLTRHTQAAEPPQRTGRHHFKRSLAAYSFHRWLPKAWTTDTLGDAKFTLEQFIDFCAAQNLDGCELTAYYFPKDITTDYLLGLKERTFRLGLDISGTAIGNNFCVADPEERERQLQMTRDWIDYSAILGAPVIRIFAGTTPAGDTEEAARERCLACLHDALDYAASKGVCLALENHGGITATSEQLLKIVEGVAPSPWFGINFDSGNFHTDDPYADLARIAPYAINAQIKVEMSNAGKQEPTDMPRVVDILKAAGYRGYVTLEYEAEADPLTEIPKHLETIRTLTLS